MRAMIVYESMFGNTQDVAHAIAVGLSRGAAVDIFEVGGAPTTIGGDIDLLVVGAPTHAFGLSRDATRQEAGTHAAHLVSSGRGMREWLDAVRIAPQRTRAAAFGTVVAAPRWVRSLGTAAGVIERRLRALGLEVVAAAGQFRVEDVTGPLSDGEEARATAWAAGIVDGLTAQPRPQSSLPMRTAPH